MWVPQWLKPLLFRPPTTASQYTLYASRGACRAVETRSIAPPPILIVGTVVEDQISISYSIQPGLDPTIGRQLAKRIGIVTREFLEECGVIEK